jgi:hypothetical protein
LRYLACSGVLGGRDRVEQRCREAAAVDIDISISIDRRQRES